MITDRLSQNGERETEREREIFIEYGHEAKPSILGLQIVVLDAPRDYGGGYYDYRARQEL